MKKRLGRAITVALAVVLMIFGLAGCGGKKNVLHLYSLGDDTLVVHIEGDAVSGLTESNGLELKGRAEKTAFSIDLKTTDSYFLERSTEGEGPLLGVSPNAFAVKDNEYFAVFCQQNVAKVVDEYSEYTLVYSEKYEDKEIGKYKRSKVKEEITGDKLAELAVKFFGDNELVGHWEDIYAPRGLDGEKFTKNVDIKSVGGNVLLITTEIFGTETKLVGLEKVMGEVPDRIVTAKLLNDKIGNMEISLHLGDETDGYEDKFISIFTYYEQEDGSLEDGPSQLFWLPGTWDNK